MLATSEKSTSGHLRHKRCQIVYVSTINCQTKDDSTLVRTRPGEKNDNFRIFKRQDQFDVGVVRKARPYFRLFLLLITGSIQISLAPPERKWQETPSAPKPRFLPQSPTDIISTLVCFGTHSPFFVALSVSSKPNTKEKVTPVHPHNRLLGSKPSDQTHRPRTRVFESTFKSFPRASPPGLLDHL